MLSIAEFADCSYICATKHQTSVFIRNNKMAMKKSFIICVALIALAVVMAVTCPKKEAHVQAVDQAVTSAMDKAMADKDDVGFGMVLGNVVAKTLSSTFLSGMIDVDDYVLFSRGTISMGNQTETVSWGVLNHVFTIDDDDLANAMKEYDWGLDF